MRGRQWIGSLYKVPSSPKPGGLFRIKFYHLNKIRVWILILYVFLNDTLKFPRIFYIIYWLKKLVQFSPFLTSSIKLDLHKSGQNFSGNHQFHFPIYLDNKFQSLKVSETWNFKKILHLFYQKIYNYLLTYFTSDHGPQVW